MNLALLRSVRHGLKSDTGGKLGVWGPQWGPGAGPQHCYQSTAGMLGQNGHWRSVWVLSMPRPGGGGGAILYYYVALSILLCNFKHTVM